LNVHEEWTDKLSDFLDGELPADEQRAVEAHLRGCGECAAVLADLKRVVVQAQKAGAVPRPPSADLWGGIAVRIDSGSASGAERSAQAPAERPAGATVTPFADRPAKAFALQSRRFAFTLPQLAAAAALVAAVSGGLVWRVVERASPRPQDQVAATRPAPRAAEPSTGAADGVDRVVPVSMADAQYDAAVSDLEGALKQGRGRLDAATIGIVEHNLQIIDQAIDQARQALAADPANT
jgi:anti-sigma factor RsiW